MFRSQGALLLVLFVPALSTAWLLSSVFGHVLAHEIGHVLRREDSHAETGLMRARWSERDFTSIKLHAFGFTPEDAQSIRDSVMRDFEPVE